jgi:hypothetical protein
MRLGECKAPGEVTRGFRLARVDHGAVSLCGSGSSAERGVWPWTREGSMGVDGRGSAGGFDRRRQSGARAVHAAHRKSGGPVARGRGGGLTERGRVKARRFVKGCAGSHDELRRLSRFLAFGPLSLARH